MKNLFILFTALIIISCASGPSKPEWIHTHPQDKLYYIGIGYSNSGIEGEDRELARKAAISEMASSISTSIKGELEVIQRESSDGENFSSVTNKITENINHVLEGISIHDSYYSPKDGYWIYVRFSKADFEMQKQRLRERVIGMIQEAESGDISKRISAAVTAIGLLYESPYIASIKDETGSGILLDKLEAAMFDYVSGIKITPSEKLILAVPGKAVPFTALVTYMDEGVEGIPVIALGKENNNSVTVFSGPGGKIDSSLDFGNLKSGENEVILSIDSEKMNIDKELMRKKLTIPEFQCIVRMDQLKANLNFTQNGGTAVPGVEGMTKALFSENKFPITITDDNTPLSIDVELIIEDFPRFDEKSLYISQARLIIHLKKSENTIYTYESSAKKDGGLTLSQSYERTVKKLYKSLETDVSYIEGITSHLGIE